MSASCVAMMTSPGVSESSLAGIWLIISWLPLSLLLSIIVFGGVIWGLFSWQVTRKTVGLFQRSSPWLVSFAGEERDYDDLCRGEVDKQSDEERFRSLDEQPQAHYPMLPTPQ